ncbi:hypothetical protein AX15_003494 [Amanita polypyramis BW_CC]|nr:hypothetical protein AX15_003494 [Amanita polypyramis BW_CC]
MTRIYPSIRRQGESFRATCETESERARAKALTWHGDTPIVAPSLPDCMSAPLVQSSSVNARNHVMTRRRAHILERAQAQLSGSACGLTTRKKGKGRQVSQATEDISFSCVSDFGSRSESSTEPAAPISDGDSVFSTPEAQSELRANSQPCQKSTSRAWYEFDLAVLVALVSPVGHWLTGGDHIKNLFMLILLIYYLHQIIEVPWTIYQKARLQRPSSNSPTTTAEEKYQQIAASELRKIELLFLFLTALSPFLGAVFLHHATAATIGLEAVSWFNVSLFVLATGMRPWAHIVERLKQRTSDLHEVVQCPIPPSVAATTGELTDRLHKLTRSIGKLEKNARRNEVKRMELREDIYHDIDEMSGILRNHERRQVRHESKIKDMEDTLKRVKNGQTKRIPTGLISLPLYLLRYVLPSWVYMLPYRILVRTVYAASTSPKNGKLAQSQSLSPSSTPKPIMEEGCPLLAQSTHVTSGVLSRIGYVAMLPLRTILRMVLRRY